MILGMNRVVAFAILVTFVATFQPIAQAQAAAAPTDAEIFGIVVAANQIDIDYAKLALSKSKNKDVQDFAQHVITDHSEVQKAIFDWGAKLNMRPADSDNSKSLKSQSEETTKKLNSLKRRAFDKAYIDNEVAYHLELLNANYLALIPNVQNIDLKAALNGAQLLFQGHLQHAETVQKALENNKETTDHKHIQ